MELIHPRGKTVITAAANRESRKKQGTNDSIL
jgi:hypothetical protein